MSGYKVEICGVNTSELPVYSGAQTDALLRRAAAGDRGARDELIRGNLRLFQVGCIGLMKSIDHFNTELGVRFSTYAVPMNVPCGNPPIHHKRTAKTIYKGENYAILQH